MRFFKMLLLAVGTYIAIGVIDLLLGRGGIHLGTNSILAVYGILAVLLIYFPSPKRQYSFKRVKPVEYIANGQGQPTDRIFDPTQFSGYTEMDSDSTGRTFADAAGKIICTCYVKPGQTTGGTSRLHLAVLCLLTVLMGVAFEALFRGSQWDVLADGWDHIRFRLSVFDLKSMWLHIRSNVESVLDTVKQIRLDLDLNACIQIIKENLEELSILKFIER